MVAKALSAPGNLAADLFAGIGSACNNTGAMVSLFNHVYDQNMELPFVFCSGRDGTKMQRWEF